MRKYDWAKLMYKPVIVTRPDGTEIEYESQRHATQGEGIPQSYVSKLCNCKWPHWKQYKARFRDHAPTIIKSGKLCKHCGSWMPFEKHGTHCPRNI